MAMLWIEACICLGLCNIAEWEDHALLWWFVLRVNSVENHLGDRPGGMPEESSLHYTAWYKQTQAES